MLTEIDRKTAETGTTNSKTSNAKSYLWILLHNKKLNGKKFLKNYSIGGFKVDFYCPEEKLALIVNGEEIYTDFNLECEFELDNFLKSKKIDVIHITADTVMNKSRKIIDRLLAEFKDN